LARLFEATRVVAVLASGAVPEALGWRERGVQAPEVLWAERRRHDLLVVERSEHRLAETDVR
jgi:hypothetical protein